MKKHAFNPFLPLDVYIPDGEPHVFGDRVYLFGSHDRENGDTFCELPYMVYSAPLEDLSQWTTPGISYDASQDPLCEKEKGYLYAPDVVQGNDGRFYLYYCISGVKGQGGYANPISVAVCNKPDGKYEYLGQVRDKSGRPLMRYICFDPAVINDQGIIRLYYGACYPFEEHDEYPREKILAAEAMVFHRPMEEITAAPDGIMGAMTVELADDMLTAVTAPKRIIPTNTKGTAFYGHQFYEGSSIRKVGNKYYFIYSSWLNHELCYATSDFPDQGFEFGGTIVSNGDVGYHGRKAEDRINATGTTHGSIEQINGQWYVFYHRQTHACDYSRQACAERITILPDGTIPQVEMTSCGLNNAPLKAEGTYPAVICCNLTNGHMPHGSNKKQEERIPCITSRDGERFVGNVENGTWIGYKYFCFSGPAVLSVVIRGQSNGNLKVCREMGKNPLVSIPITPSETWQNLSAEVAFPEEEASLFFLYEGEGEIDILKFSFAAQVY